MVQMNPIVVQVVEEPTPETNVADVLLGAVGFVGVILLAALVVGLVAGAIFIALRKRRLRRQVEEDAFSASPLTR